MNSSVSAHRIPGVPNVLVDGFRYQLQDTPSATSFYVLSHFHSDHYMGLSSTFNRGTILCTSTTANLICTILGVKREFVKCVDYNQCMSVFDDISITFLDANHCPGAAILLFKLPNNINYLHTGDMRYSSSMQRYEHLLNVKIDKVFLDTTYAHPRHVFMDQSQAIVQVVAHAKEFLQEDPLNVVLLCAYTIGKEKLVFAVVDEVTGNVCVDEDKRRILGCLDVFGPSGRSEEQVVTDKRLSRFHVCKMGLAGSVLPFFKPSFDGLLDYREALIADGMSVANLLCIVPTGWADNSSFNRDNSRLSQGAVSVQLVPYSEHSNFTELKAFVKFLKPREVVPTVYKDEDDRIRILDLFRAEVNSALSKRLFIEKIASGKKTYSALIVEETWTCQSCTYIHRRSDEKLFVQCAMCCSARNNVAETVPQNAIVSKMGRKKNLTDDPPTSKRKRS